jgi:uroporphyrinogen decarboxylase
MYVELILPSYQPIFDVLENFGVSTIIWRTYANTRLLIPSALTAGINCLWACECGTDAMDYRKIRKDYGQDLRLIGGIDLDALHGSWDDIKKEVMKKVPPLLHQGGYLPLLDGRVRKIVPFAKYKYFRQMLEAVVST